MNSSYNIMFTSDLRASIVDILVNIDSKNSTKAVFRIMNNKLVITGVKLSHEDILMLKMVGASLMPCVSLHTGVNIQHIY